MPKHGLFGAWPPPIGAQCVTRSVGVDPSTRCVQSSISEAPPGTFICICSATDPFPIA